MNFRHFYCTLNTRVFPYSNCLDFVVIVTAGFCEVQKNWTNFSLHISLGDEALLQQNKQRCLAGLSHLENMWESLKPVLVLYLS